MEQRFDNERFEYELLQRQRKQEQERRKKREKELIRKHSVERQRKEAKRNLRMKIETMSSIVVVMGMIGLMLFRMSGIFELQREYNTLVSEARVTHKNNEDLRGKIMKYDNIVHLSQRAEQLPLNPISDENTLGVNLARNNFKEDEMAFEGRWIDKLTDTAKGWMEKLL